MKHDERRNTLEGWLFNYTEPPFDQSSEELTQEYISFLTELKHVEPESTWEIADLVVTPDEIQMVISERLEWLASKVEEV